MAANPISDEEIMSETNDKLENSSLTNDENNVQNQDDSFNLLEGRWTFWYTHRPTTFRNSAVNYDSCLKKLGTFGSIEEFWYYYDHMKFPSELPFYSDVHLFKESLKPMWEEEGNRLGGKWILRLKKGLSTRLWESLVLAIIGEQFNVGKEICGIVCSIRPQEDLISIWTKTANNQLVTQRIKETMKKVLSLPQDCPLEYKTHNDSLRDNCSYRNTDRVRANSLWYIPIIGGLVQFAIVTFRPNLMPYEILGPYGQFTKFLAYNHHCSLVWGFWIAIGLHFLEAVIAYRICRKLHIDAFNTIRWFLQTLSLGYVSLGKLRKYAAKKR
ncbi:unnamed protein product [Rotaria socialis]|uniref:EIF-4F 25 kDa subunit n=3 Tax=Rotaria socialis TaxID=392032 RepID=A0A820IR49_9BILA|nr:unnamed protein product [Rotaria socialis]CAF4159469.1 unnamed protein product [Rotaria socialis]CAF4315862.1 unnamed protein product [Rotaria socialis]CAF4493626.1 unnamed protein product [Rotaria socialis]CAF4582002.1 unnamed protein product [Rotaria socialis]